MLFHKCGIGTLGNSCFKGQTCTEVSSPMMLNIRSYIHYIESCKIYNTAVFIHQYLQYHLAEDFCLGKVPGSGPQVTGKLLETSSILTKDHSLGIYHVFLESVSILCLFVFLLYPCRFTYEIAPVFVLMEQITLRKMREIIGWSNKDGDGIFSPGEFFFSGLVVWLKLQKLK